MVAIQTPLQTTIVTESIAFSHADADHVSQMATCGSSSKRIVIDMSVVKETTTSAFARLVLLRRTLLRAGRDLRLTNLRDQAAGLYEIIRLKEILPTL